MNLLAGLLRLANLVDGFIQPFNQRTPLSHIFFILLIEIDKTQAVLAGTNIKLSITQRCDKRDLQAVENFMVYLLLPFPEQTLDVTGQFLRL